MIRFAVGLALSVVASLYFASEYSPISPVVIAVPELGALEANTRLRDATHIGTNDLIGPESLAVSPDGKLMFAGLGDGRIVKIWTDSAGSETWTTVARTGVDDELCGSGGPGDTTNMEDTCGRPLGMRFVPRTVVQHDAPEDEMVLVICDAYKGLLMLRHWDTAPELSIIATRAEGDQEDFHLLNDLAVVNNVLYISETSTKFRRRRIFHAALEGRSSGRLLSVDATSSSVVVVETDLLMPNGLTPTHDGKALLVVSTVKVERYDPATRLFTLFATPPGTGDNIRSFDHTPSGEKLECYWAGWGSKYSQPFSLIHFGADKPAFRRLLAMMPYTWLVNLIPKYGMLGVLDTNGNVVETYQDPGGSTLQWVSEAEVFHGKLYFGSWYAPYLGTMSHAAVTPGG